MDKFFSSLGRGKTIAFAVACLIACTALIIGIVAKIQYDINHQTPSQSESAGSVSALGVGKLGGLEAGTTGIGNSTGQSGSVQGRSQTDIEDTDSNGNSAAISEPVESKSIANQNPQTEIVSNGKSSASNDGNPVSTSDAKVSENFTSNLANVEGTMTETSKPLVVEFKKISIEGANIEIGEVPHYTGTPVEPTVSVRLGNGIAISSGTDYTVSYFDNDRGGTATVIVTGIGDYEGNATKTFEIISDIPEEPAIENAPEEVSKQEPEVSDKEADNVQSEVGDSTVANIAEVQDTNTGNAEKMERSQEILTMAIAAKVEEMSAYEEGLEQIVGEEKYAEYVANVENNTRFAVPDLSIPHMLGSLRIKAKNGLSIDEINAALNGIDKIYTKSITTDDISFGWFGIRCPDDTDLAALIEELSHVEAFDNAQLDCVYFTSEEASALASRTFTFSYGDFAEVDANSVFVPGSSSQDGDDSQIQSDMTDPGFGVSEKPTDGSGGEGTSLGTQSEDSPPEYYSSDMIDPSSTWELSAVRAPYAWSLVQDPSSVTVAVMDTGCLNAYDLTNNIVGSYDAVRSTEAITDVDANEAHGTHVCGIISAETDNAYGTAGISNNAKLYPVCVAAWDSVNQMAIASDTTLASAYDHIIKKKVEGQNIRVANVSLGSPRGSDAYLSSASDIELYERITQAQSAGILTVVAAGNDWLDGKLNGNNDMSSYLQWPAMANARGLNVIALAREFDQSKGEYATVRADYSNCEYVGNNVVTIAAPGSDIASVGKDGGIAVKSGTSQAAPCVSGVAALVFAANSTLDVADVKEIIEQTAQDITYNKERTYKWFEYGSTSQPYHKVTGTEVAGVGEDQYTGYGMVDAEAAVREALLRISYEEPEIANPDNGNETPNPNNDNIDLLGDNDNNESSNNNNSNESGTETDPVVPPVQTPQAIDVNSLSMAQPSSKIYDGYEYKPFSTSFEANGQTYYESKDYTVTYSNNLDAGRGSVTITGKGSLSGSRTFAFNINQCRIDEVVYQPKGFYYYNAGKPVDLKITMYRTGKGVPVKGVDYTVTQDKNTNVGSYKATITGIGNYYGTCTFNYDIVPCDIGNWYKSLKIADYVYTGKPITPVKGASGEIQGTMYKLVLGTDVVTSYKNNVKAGTATVTIAGKGNYCGTVTKTFKILNKNTLCSGNVSWKIHTGTKSNKLTAAKTSKAWKDIKSTKLKGNGTITFKKASGSSQLSINSKTGKITVKKGTKRGTYTMKVQVTAKGDATHAKVSITKTVKVTVVK